MFLVKLPMAVALPSVPITPTNQCQAFDTRQRLSARGVSILEEQVWWRSPHQSINEQAVYGESAYCLYCNHTTMKMVWPVGL